MVNRWSRLYRTFSIPTKPGDYRWSPWYRLFGVPTAHAEFVDKAKSSGCYDVDIDIYTDGSLGHVATARFGMSKILVAYEKQKAAGGRESQKGCSYRRAVQKAVDFARFAAERELEPRINGQPVDEFLNNNADLLHSNEAGWPGYPDE